MKNTPFITRKTIVAFTAIVVVLALWKPLFGGWHRPYINETPWDLAEHLVKNQRPASECFDLIWWEIMSPPQIEQQANCVYEYAKLTKDPSACELLMPSSYGLSCVGGQKILIHVSCLLMDKKV